jgi:hypothetical protein
MSTQHTAPYQICADVVAALEASQHFTAGPDAARVLSNPTSPSSLKDGPRVVFVEDGSDDLVQQPGQREQRTFSFTVGVIARTVDARAQADIDAREAKAVVKGIYASLVASHACQALRHRRTEYRVEGIDVGGALRLMIFELEYRG